MCWNNLCRELNTISVEGREGSWNDRCGGWNGGCGCNSGWNSGCGCNGGCNFRDFPAYISIPFRNPYNGVGTTGQYNGGGSCCNGIL